MTLFPSIKHNSREEKRFKALFNSKKRNPSEEKEMRELRDQHEFRIICETDVIFSTLDSSSKFSIARNNCR